MASKEDMVLDHSLLLATSHDDQDILNEFLDQRVFDSMNANSPNPSDHVKLEDFENFHSELFSRLKDEQTPIKAEAVSPAHSSPPLFRDATDELGMALAFTGPNSPQSAFSKSRNPQFDNYDVVRKEMSRVKFGNCNTNPCPQSVDVADASYLDFSADALSKLPYTLEVLDLPTYSRVETQTKLQFRLSPPPPQNLLHIPQDLISKSKFCLQNPVDSLPNVLRQNMLYMDAYVLTSDLSRSCNVCSRCIKREQKRALRSKPGPSDCSTGNSPTNGTSNMLKNNPNAWADDKMMKKAIILNCKEIISLPEPSGLANDQFQAFDFSARLVCYCRHHKEQNGFKLLFVLKDYSGQVVAKLLSTPIMIMDRKKNSAAGGKELLGSDSRMANLDLSENLEHDLDSGLHPLSPKSIDDSPTEGLANTDTNTDSNTASRGLKRKKLSFDDSFNSSTNPMFNGGSGFSPLSNSDTNASIHNMNGKNSIVGGVHNFGSSSSVAPQAVTQSLSIARQGLLQHLQHYQQPSLNPTIQKIIPAQGPIRGGIEVTLLGFNFRPGLIVKFGTKNALATHCWSETTIVTYLPPASQPGQVLVSFENHDDIFSSGQQLIFTYTDDTDRQLIELALQIVGLKMNGKLEDAKNIAKRIVGSDGANGAAGHTPSPNGTPGMNQTMNQANMDWYSNAHKAVEVLSRSDLSTEEILINFLTLVDLPNCPIIIPNWQLCNAEGQSLLHLATLKNYSHLIKFLITHGCKIDIQDNQGLTPLFFASMCGNRHLIKAFVDCKSNWNLKLSNDKFLKDYCDMNVLDIFHGLESDQALGGETSSYICSGSDVGEDGLNKSFSVDSLNSMFMVDYSKHISRMAMDSSEVHDGEDLALGALQHSLTEGTSELPTPKSPTPFANDSDDFADSERDSEDNLSFCEDLDHNDADQEDEYTDDYDDDYSSSDYDTDTQERVLQEGSSSSLMRSEPNLWQKVKNAVFSNDTEMDLPTYDDLFPFSNSRASAGHALDDADAAPGSKSFGVTEDAQEDVASDSSEDMVMSFINHPRKTVQNDKMLLFFWTPVLVMIICFFSFVSITGYKVEMVEQLKQVCRNTIGNLVVGHERLARVFSTEPMRHVVEL